MYDHFDPRMGMIGNAIQLPEECPPRVFAPLTAYVPGTMGQRSIAATTMVSNYHMQRNAQLAALANAQQAQANYAAAQRGPVLVPFARGDETPN